MDTFNYITSDVHAGWEKVQNRVYSTDTAFTQQKKNMINIVYKRKVKSQQRKRFLKGK